MFRSTLQNGNDHPPLAKNNPINEPPGVSEESLIEFLTSHLRGSSLRIRKISDRELTIEGDGFLVISIMTDDKARSVTFEINSPELKRHVRIEDLDGFDYMEMNVEDELHKLSLDNTADDVLLALDLLRSWARANNYKISEIGSKEEYSPVQKMPMHHPGKLQGPAKRKKKTK